MRCRKNQTIVISLVSVAIIASILIPLTVGGVMSPLAGRNLIFQATSVTDVSTGKSVPLGGSGNVRSYGDFYFVTGEPALVDLSAASYVATGEDTVLEQRVATFAIDTWMYTTPSWDRACQNGANPVQGSYDWFKLQKWKDNFWGDKKVGGVETSTVYWDDYQLKPDVSSNKWMEFKDPVIEIGWAGDLFSFEWNHPNTTAGLGVSYQFSYQFTDLYAIKPAEVMEIGEYSDTLNIIDQKIGVSVNNFDNVDPSISYSQLTTQAQTLLQTQNLLGQLGVSVIRNPNIDDYRQWTSVQTARVSAPQEGAPFISAGDRPDPNTGTEVTLSGYSIRPSVYAAQQVFVVNWGEYDMTTELGDSWAPGTVGQIESSAWIASGESLSTRNTHGQTTPKARTAAVHVANKAAEQMYYLEMEVSATIALEGVTPAQWIGRPQLVQDNKTWNVFFTGNTQAGVDFLSSYSWNDLFHDIGVGLNSLLSAFLGPIITIFVVVIVALFLIYAGPSTFKAIGSRIGKRGKR